MTSFLTELFMQMEILGLYSYHYNYNIVSNVPLKQNKKRDRDRDRYNRPHKYLLAKTIVWIVELMVASTFLGLENIKVHFMYQMGNCRTQSPSRVLLDKGVQ